MYCGKLKELDDFQVILINGQFPGPTLETVTNENIILNVVNKLDQPFLLTWYVAFSESPCIYMLIGAHMSHIT